MSRPVARCVLASTLAVLATALAVTAAGPAAAMPFEGDPDAGHCVRIVHRHTLWPDEKVPANGYVGLPYVAILVPRAEC